LRIALIADIHGNLGALDAVLAAIERDRVDQVISLGDVAASGPQPREVIERLRGLGCRSVMGNTDAWLLSPSHRVDADEDWRRIEAIDEWCAAQLGPAQLDYLRSFEPLVRLPLADDASMLCFHGSPRSFDEVMVATTPDDQLEEMLAGHRALVMAGGHTHVQMLRRFGEALMINPGSVGLPFERAGATGPARNPPWAEYALVEWREGEASVAFRRVPVDSRATVDAILRSGMPHAEWWAQDW
jgi:predicted phosphodiesterase